MYEIRAFMYDIARGMRGDVAYLSGMIERLAKYGYNMLIINIEYRFKFPSNPSIGTADSLTPENVKMLDAIARKNGIELVPFANCAGHCEGIGSLEKYKHLCPDPTGIQGTLWRGGTTDVGKAVNPATFVAEQLLVGDSGAMDLVKDLYNDLLECFSSKYFHIGFDEVRQMHKQMPESTPVERWETVMKHLLEIIDFVKSKGKIPMMWADMFSRHTERESYLSQLPKDVIMCEAYYGNTPELFDLETPRTLMFKNPGFKTLLSPAANGFRGNPVLCVDSTANIRKMNKVVENVYGKEVPGTILCHWETDFGGSFSAHWPWIYLQGKLYEGNIGENYDDLNFLQEYTNLEWGLDDNSLEKWYALAETKVNKSIQKCMIEVLVKEGEQEDEVGSDVLMVPRRLKDFKRGLFRSKNILPVLWDAKWWLNSDTVKEIIPYLDEAEKVAEKMYQESKANRTEPLCLYIWTGAYKAIFKLMMLMDQLSESYSFAAKCQGLNDNKYRMHIIECCEVMSEMLIEMEAMQSWAEATVLYENCSREEAWWIRQAQNDLKVRMTELLGTIHNKRSLINFNRFVRYEADIPNRVLQR